MEPQVDERVRPFELCFICASHDGYAVRQVFLVMGQIVGKGVDLFDGACVIRGSQLTIHSTHFSNIFLVATETFTFGACRGFRAS